MKCESNKKTSVFRLRLTDDQKSKLQLDSETLDISASEFARRRLFSKPLPQQNNYRAIRKLSTLSRAAKHLPVSDKLKQSFLSDISDLMIILGDNDAGKS